MKNKVKHIKTLEQFKKDAFKRPGARKVYVEMQPEFKMVRTLILSKIK